MITDSLESLPSELECEVCVAGAGPAGITLALELARGGRHVLLLEGGGLDLAGDGEALYQGGTDGRPYPLAGSRLRWLGGTSNHWGGWVKPLDAADFVDKPHFPLPGWPLALSDLAEGYRRAAQWCEVGSDQYDARVLGLAQAGLVLDVAPEDGFENHVFRFSPPTRFGTRYREALEQSEHLDCRLNLNLARLEAGEGTIRVAEARTLNGGRCRIRAEHFVLAMGGLENARFLLNQQPVSGNGADLVGRCFMDHFGFAPGVFMTDGALRYERLRNGEDDIMPVLAPGADLILDQQLANACVMLSAQAPDPHLPPEYWSSPLFMHTHGHRDETLHCRMVMINEPLPHPESRITLTDERDDLGLRRLHLHWYLPESDFYRPLKLVEHLVVAAGRRGWGRLQWTARESPGPNETPGVGFHHMGTTRMSADPDAGVVNADCRVWDQDNLYVAGSSVFSTAGYANPTLTIVALACRLAEHLAGRLESA